MSRAEKSPACGEAQNTSERCADEGKFTAYSTSKQAQLDRIINALSRRPHSSHDLRSLGIYQVSTRIKELRELGHDIRTDRVTLVDAWGYEHRRCALYSLGGAQ